MQNLSGFLLSYIKYGDHDAVLQCFTKENGYQSLFVRGIYSQKNKKKAYLMPLNELQFSLNAHVKNGSLPQVSKIELVENRDLYTNVKTNAMVFFIADFLSQILQLENQNEEIYRSISLFLEEIGRKNYQAHFIFLFIIIEILGFEPLDSESDYLNPESGSFEIEISHPAFTSEISRLYKVFSSEDQKYKAKIPALLKKDFLESLLIYFRYHLPDFREPKSLEILQQIFD